VKFGAGPLADAALARLMPVTDKKHTSSKLSQVRDNMLYIFISP
jgi:hypothetical protein